MKVHLAQSNNLTPYKTTHSRRVIERLANSALITFGIHVCANQPPTKPISLNLPQFSLTTPATAQTRTINLPTPVLRPNP